MDFLVNAGVYLLEPCAYRYIPTGEGFNMTNLVRWLLEDRRTGIGFPVREYWRNLGQPVDYNQGQTDVTHGAPDWAIDAPADTGNTGTT